MITISMNGAIDQCALIEHAAVIHCSITKSEALVATPLLLSVEPWIEGQEGCRVQVCSSVQTVCRKGTAQYEF